MESTHTPDKDDGPVWEVDLMVRLGLIQHDYDGHVLQDASGHGVGALHHFYRQADRG